MYVGLIPVRHQTLGTDVRHGDILRRHASIKWAEWGTWATWAAPPSQPCLSPHARRRQSPRPIRHRCRRPRTRAASPRSPHRCEGARRPPATPGRGLAVPRPQPRRAGCCLIGCADAPTLPALESRAGSRRWGWWPPDAGGSSAENAISHHGRGTTWTRRRMQC